MSSPIKAVILTGFGLNCDYETAAACDMAGAQAHRVHINALISGRITLDDFHLLVFGGGFSWGDDHGAGVIQAVKIGHHLGDALESFIAAGKLILGICNGFQTLVNLGLLPGFAGDFGSSRRVVALTHNDCGNFRDQWVHLAVSARSPCVFTQGMDHLSLPVRHGEGKFVAPEPVLNKLMTDNHVVMRYADATFHPAGGKFPENPNGSLYDIAGICDASGRIFGLMPHPEAFLHPVNHPDFTRAKHKAIRSKKTMDMGETPGVRMFRNGITYIRKAFC
jgi:phosphoribosylformylglycinamidine synthase subunit PurQ / glutaminase